MTEAVLSDEDVIKTRNSLEMMRRPHLWPHRRLLPMTRREGSEKGYIVVCALGTVSGGTMRYAVREGPLGLGGLGGDIIAAHGGDFLLRTLVDAGWEVD